MTDELKIPPYSVSIEVDRCMNCNGLLSEGGPIGQLQTMSAEFPVHVKCWKGDKE